MPFRVITEIALNTVVFSKEVVIYQEFLNDYQVSKRECKVTAK